MTRLSRFSEICFAVLWVALILATLASIQVPKKCEICGEDTAAYRCLIDEVFEICDHRTEYLHWECLGNE